MWFTSFFIYNYLTLLYNGQLIEMAAKKGKATRPDIHLGICGEHGGDPSSVEFCYRAGLDYVS